MKIFIDTGHLKDIEALVPLGIMTVPMPPSPSCSMILYAPICAPTYDIILL